MYCKSCNDTHHRLACLGNDHDNELKQWVHSFQYWISTHNRIDQHHMPNATHMQIDIVSIVHNQLYNIKPPKDDRFLYYTKLPIVEGANDFIKHKPLDIKYISYLLINNFGRAVYKWKGVQWAVAQFYLNCKTSLDYTLFELILEKSKDSYNNSSRLHIDKNRYCKSLCSELSRQKWRDASTILNKYILNKDLIYIILDY